jgi:hypothetical protein
MTLPPPVDVSRPRGHAYRQPDKAKPGRVVPTLAPGPPPERAVAVFARLARLAMAPQGRRKLPEVRLPLPSVAAWLGCSTRTTKRRLAELRAHGWIAGEREQLPGGRGGWVKGHGRLVLVWPTDLNVPGQIEGPTDWRGRAGGP